MAKTRISKAVGGTALAALACAMTAALASGLSRQIDIAWIAADYPVRIAFADIEQAQSARRQVAGPAFTLLAGDDPHAIETETADVPARKEDAGKRPELTALPSASAAAPPLTSEDRTPPVRRFQIAGGHEVMEMDFHLARAAPLGATQISKDVFRGGKRIGQVDMTVDGGARIFVSRESLQALFPDALRGAAMGDGTTIPLAVVRDHGIDLRYDPVGDVMVAGVS